MAKVENCPGFETFGADVKAARKAKHLSRKAMAEKVNIDWRYLANIENDGTIPSLPVPFPPKYTGKRLKKRNESQVYSVMLLYAASQSRRRFSKSRGGSQPREEWGRMVL